VITAEHGINTFGDDGMLAGTTALLVGLVKTTSNPKPNSA